MTDFTTQRRYRTRHSMAVAACLAWALSGCGLELSSREQLTTSINVVATPTPTPSSGPTAAVTGTINGQNVAFNYVLLNTDAHGQTALEFLSYDPCLWVTTHSAATFPRDFNTLIVNLVSINAAPGPGVYVDVSGTNNTTTMTVDPQSSYGAINACKGTWTALAAGTSVTIKNIDTAHGTAEGSISALLSGGGILSGSFNTTSCASETSNFAADAAGACSSLQ